ncbi:HD-GYP domain-containing protein [Azotosporobacter soli]|uniref:HD-GYP domain-containing protein n=1 Tax=Azotosporobacter soli TaxID=3055040 RepID=UPI0031FF2832
MNLISTKDLVPGMCIENDMVDAEGLVKLLAKGAVLDQAQIERLGNWGAYVRVDDAEAAARRQELAENKARTEFVNSYKETIEKITYTFRQLERNRSVPIVEILEIVDQKINFLVESIGALDYLHGIRCHSEHTFNHALNVAVLTGILGKWCGYKEAELRNLILAGLLHDIGKLVLPLAVLDKPGRLSAEEFAIIKTHPREGYRVVEADGQIGENVKQVILQHHERMDGSGYPRGMVGAEIHEAAKIVSIADVYDAITSDRPYQKKATPFKALDILREEMFEKLEPNICMIFLDSMRDYFTGSRVLLSNGEKAKIISFTPNVKSFTKPVVCMSSGVLVDLQTTDIYI